MYQVTYATYYTDGSINWDFPKIVTAQALTEQEARMTAYDAGAAMILDVREVA
jgi:hypothetical protein